MPEGYKGLGDNYPGANRTSDDNAPSVPVPAPVPAGAKGKGSKGGSLVPVAAGETSPALENTSGDTEIRFPTYASLSNRFRAITHEQFKSLSRQFKHAVEDDTGVPCKMEITFFRAPKGYITLDIPEIQDALDAQNAEKIVTSSETATYVNKELWDTSAHVTVNVRPVNGSGPPSAWGHMEFKGSRPRHATMYIQPDGDAVADAMRRQNRGMVFRDGDSRSHATMAIDQTALARAVFRDGKSVKEASAEASRNLIAGPGRTLRLTRA